VKRVSRGSLAPAHHSNAKRENTVDLVFRVVLFFFIWGRLPLREAIGTTVFVGRDMHQFEVEKKNGRDLVIDGGV
jgi:hypothetical protein